MSVRTLDDKLCAALVTDAAGNVSIQVTNATAGASVDSELTLFCDAGNADQKFYGVVQYNNDGTFSAASTIDLAGAAYAPIGPIEVCSATDVEFAQLCDDNGAFVRGYDQTGALLFTIDSAGNPYTPVGPIKALQATDYETVHVPACDQLPDGSQQIFYWEVRYFDGIEGQRTALNSDGSFYQPVNPVESLKKQADKVVVHERATGANTYAAPFREFAVTAYSADVTINGQAIEAGQVVILDEHEDARYLTDQAITGTDYFVTFVQ